MGIRWKTAASLTCAVLVGTSCSSMGERTKKGGIAGVVAGGVVGAATGGAKGAAIGAAAGGATGAAIGNYLDRRAKELSNVVETEKTKNGLKVTLQNDLLFDFDRSTLRQEAQQTLNELADILMKYPGDQLRIEGFTDYIGPAEYNQQLSEERAQAVRSYLTSQGVDDERMKAIGKGEAPDQTKTAEGRQKNRRVEIFINPQTNRKKTS